MRYDGRRHKVKVRRKVHGEGPREVKGGREYAWTEGPEESGKVIGDPCEHDRARVPEDGIQRRGRPSQPGR